VGQPQTTGCLIWFTTEMANLRTAFRWAADQGDLDMAATIATFVGLVGFLAENYEPIAWAEELVEPARADNHPRLLFLYQIASVCYMTGRIEAAVSYVEAIGMAKRDGRDAIPFGLEGMAGGVYLMIGQPQRTVEWCRNYLERGLDTHSLTKAALVNALVIAGSAEGAIAAADGIITAAEATNNPWVLSYALLCYGMAYRDTDPARALQAMRRGLKISRESGNRFNESHLALNLSFLETKHGDPLTALEYITLSIHNYHDAGSDTFIHSPLASLAALLDRLECFEPAATITGFAALSPLTTAGFPELGTAVAHLRNVLGDQTYESLAREGETMSTSVVATYAYDQIDQARAKLNAVSK
jgi:hypothetical protein